jgi:hypothetical protein
MKAAGNRPGAGRSNWALRAQAESALPTIFGRVRVYLQFRDESTSHHPVKVWGGAFEVALEVRLYRNRLSFVLLKWMFVNVLLIDFSH